MKKIDITGVKTKLTLRLLAQFFSTVVLFTIGLALLFFIGIYVGHRVIVWYYPWGFWYRLFKFADSFRLYLFLLVWGIVFLLITLYFWNKTIGYVDKMTKAIDDLFENDTDLIQLPNGLKDVEERLNQIKYNIMRNQQLAKEAEQRKNDLVVYLAHDLKTPLTSIIGYLTLLRDEGQISQELREKYLSISLEKSERLEALINEFFEITRFNLKDLTLEPAKFNLTRMLEQITYEFQPLLKPKGLNCSLKAEKDIFLRGDVKKLERVFDNLIRNAISYSYQNTEILITAISRDQEVILKFCNQGDTIPEHKLNHIFEQFYRLDAARTTENGGSGLGLAIAKEIIELHGGRITASSENEMIAFEIFIPNPS
ncbi:vancomycin resistance histidine kinase VanS [Clostridium formicaceticum]|uniref:histidine kinase n=1 Tax=Clostridium formicaceticum TaxID=1497 RepID=A0AAC9RN35_9CLOT|nr:vancomycin resistance histidine kinase VanS [Clostridium formicaceticum]AOY78018.1 hypothetical protein BJL90_20415 [Clostridium formicaceticum]ARE88652.1 Alkaline phosphatase synthesis sensor protein PhoR [Clostridium formicaceticum]